MRPRLHLHPATLAARLPRRTVRLRLTALYGALFLACGAGLLAITITIVLARGWPPPQERMAGGPPRPRPSPGPRPPPHPPHPPPPAPPPRPRPHPHPRPARPPAA